MDPALTLVTSSDEAARIGTVWRFNDVVPGANNVLTIQAKVGPNTADGTKITNKIDLAFTDLDGTALGNYSSNSVQATVFRPVAGLGLNGPATAGPNDTINYTIDYNNTGTGIAKDLWLNLTLDNNLTITGSSAEAVRTGTSWHLSNVAANTKANVSVQALVAPTVGDATILQAKVSLDFIMPNGYQSAGLSAGPVTTKVLRPILQITKTVDKTTALPGDTLTYTIGFNNTGSAEGNVVITDILAPELELLNSTSEANRTGGVWTFAKVGAGSHNLLSLTARIKNDTLENITITNVASGNLTSLSGTSLGEVDTNVVTTKVGFLPVPKMTMAMTVDKATALWNETVNFTIYYNNTGAAPATTATVKVQLPVGLVFVTSDTETARKGIVWNFTAVGIGPHSLKVTAKVHSGTANNTVLTNTATLTYTDSRGRPSLLSTAHASVKAKVPYVPPPKDTTPPTILSKFPGPDAKDIAANATIQITFSEPMNRSETEKALVLSPNLSGKITWSGNTLIFTPDTAMKAGQKYTVTLSIGAKDLAGNALADPPSWSFTVVKGKTNTSKDQWGGMCLPLVIIAVILGAIVAAILVATRGKPKPTNVEHVETEARTSHKAKPKEPQKEPETKPEEKPDKEPEKVKAPPKVEEPVVPPMTPVESEVPKVEPEVPKPAEPAKDEPIKEEPAKEEPVKEEPPKEEPAKPAEPTKKDTSIDDILKKLKQ